MGRKDKGGEREGRREPGGWWAEDIGQRSEDDGEREGGGGREEERRRRREGGEERAEEGGGALCCGRKLTRPVSSAAAGHSWPWANVKCVWRMGRLLPTQRDVQKVSPCHHWQHTHLPGRGYEVGKGGEVGEGDGGRSGRGWGGQICTSRCNRLNKGNEGVVVKGGMR